MEASAVASVSEFSGGSLGGVLTGVAPTVPSTIRVGGNVKIGEPDLESRAGVSGDG